MEREHVNNQTVFLETLLHGDRNACSNLISDAMAKCKRIEDLYEQILKPSLYQVGVLWENNKISIAKEHLASAIVEGILNEVYPKIVSHVKSEKKVLVACVEKELHQIGAKMVADIFETNGWNSYFLGANTPINDVLSFAKELKPDVFALSMSLYFHLPIIEDMIQNIEDEFPETKILIGGQAFQHGGEEVINRFRNTVYLKDLYALDSFLKK